MQYTSKFSGEEIDSILDSVRDKQDAIPDLETIRSNAQNASDTIARMVESGYLFAGIATIDTNPGIPNAKVFYIANGKGTYEKFGGIKVMEDDVVVLYYDTAWHKVATGIASQAKLSELESNVAPLVGIINTNIVEPKNWMDFNDADYVTGKYIHNNTLYSDSGYNTSGYIPVKEGETYKVSWGAPFGAPKYMRFVCFYGEGRVYLSTSANVINLTIPSGVKYVRFSADARYFKKYGDAVMFYFGDTPTGYSEYFAPYSTREIAADLVDTNSIKNASITKDKLKGVFPIPFNHFSAHGVIAPNEQIANTSLRVIRNTITNVKIIGTISNIRVLFASRYLELTSDKIMIYNGINVVEYAHGLALGDYTTISLEQSSSIIASLRITDDKGGVYSKSGIDWRWDSSSATIENMNTSGSITATISVFPKDITKKVWAFGDSYFSPTNDRWTFYALEWGYTNWLMNAIGGENATQALYDLRNLLSLGARPSYILWCLGMNNGADSGDAINATWLSVTNEVISLCVENGIELVLATIPSVPSEIHTKLNEWVRASGYRYVDFAKAVELDGTTGTWKSGLLSSDNVHPSANGAKVLASAVISDFPEITLN